VRFREDDGRFSEIGHGDLDRGERRAQVVRNGADQCRTPLVDFLEEVCPQRLVAELGTFDRKSSVVGIGREQPPVVDVERRPRKTRSPTGRPAAVSGICRSSAPATMLPVSDAGVPGTGRRRSSDSPPSSAPSDATISR